MASIKTYTYTSEDLTAFSNQVKEVFVDALLQSGEISDEQAETFTADYAVIISEKSFLGKLWDKARGLTSEGPFYQVVRGITR